MKVFEIGLFHAGLPLVSRQYYEKYKVDPLLRSGFLSALNSFAEEVFSDEIESFVMKNFRIVILSSPFSSDDYITSYCISSKKLSPKIAKRALIRVLEEFCSKYDHLKSLTCDIAIFDEFLPILDDILGDLTKSASDRAKSVFG